MSSRTAAAVASLDHVSKRYRLGLGHGTLRSWLAAVPAALLRRSRTAAAAQEVWALRDVSFQAAAGEALGLIGPNGAGKTTALKLLANITYPTCGDVWVSGRLSALIELGAGFHPDLTGRENVYLNGAIMGLTRTEVARRFDSIVSFAELEPFIDTPVKRYSSGMYARLGFAVAAHVEPDVLLVDEVLSVGDMAFQSRCHRRMAELLARGTTLIFVSHNLEAVRRVCSRTLVLYRGRLAFEGSADEAAAEYSNILRRAALESGSQAAGEGALGQRQMSQRARIERVALLNADGNGIEVIRSGSRARLAVTVHFLEDARAPVFACTVRTGDGQVVYDTTTRWQGQDTPDFRAGDRAQVEFLLEMNLIDGVYQAGTDVAYADLSQYYDRVERALDFVVHGNPGAQGISDLRARISFEAGAIPAPGGEGGGG